MVVRHRLGNNKPEKGSVPAGNPGITPQKALNELTKLGFGKKLNIQLAELKKTIKDPKHLLLMSELLILRAHAGYNQHKKDYIDENNNEVKVPNKIMETTIDREANSILDRYKGEKESDTFGVLINNWRDERNKLAADFKADI